MITYNTYIDKVTIRVDFDYIYEQEEALGLLLGNIINNPSYKIEGKNISKNETDYKEYSIYSNFTPVGTISTETISNINNSFEYIHVLTFTFDKLKRYSDITDNSSFLCLLHCCMLLNQRFIDFKLTEIDICLDAVCEQDHTLGMKRISNQAKCSNMARIVNVSNHIFQNDIRRLKFKVNVEDFNHMNANVQVIQEATVLYDFFYFNYEEEITRLGIYLEDAQGNLKKKEVLNLDLDAIEIFIGTLFFTYGNQC